MKKNLLKYTGIIFVIMLIVITSILYSDLQKLKKQYSTDTANIPQDISDADIEKYNLYKVYHKYLENLDTEYTPNTNLSKFEDENMTVRARGEEIIYNNAKPYRYNESLYIPLKETVESLGHSYITFENEVVLNIRENKIKLYLDDTKYEIIPPKIGSDYELRGEEESINIQVLNNKIVGLSSKIYILQKTKQYKMKTAIYL